jgi:glycosyltransferase involved in cell wall biosynthesis
MTRSLLVIQDSLDFGGHEAMFLRFLPALIESGNYRRIVMRLPDGNARLAERLRPFESDRFEARGWDFSKRRAEPYLAGFRRDYARAFRHLFAAERPAAVLLLQGRIENCAVPMLAAPAGSFLISYMPMAHRMTDMGRATVPGDLVRRRLYGRPNRFIVPGHAVAEQVARAGGHSPVSVVENVVDPPASSGKEVARAALGVGQDARIALFLGRLDVRQKGIDTLLAAIRRHADRLAGWTFVFIGAGEGAAACESLRDDLQGRVEIRCVPWTERPQEALAAADLLLMPSRWEGVPLVMLEAMGHGLPILASDIDVFRDYLPAANRIDFAIADLAGAMTRVIEPEQADLYRLLARKRLAESSLARSSEQFVEALLPEGADA